MPVDFNRFDLRGDTVAYTAYVPPGSLAAGRNLAESGGGAGIVSCTACHGPALQGTPIAPPLAGRSPTALFRQLYGFSIGARRDAACAPMRAEVAHMTPAEMIAAAAYAASLPSKPALQ